MDDDTLDEFDPTDPANIEVGRRLDAYAEARLTPSAGATTRARTAVMSAAHRQAALRDASGATPSVSANPARVAIPAPPPADVVPPSHVFRRAFLALVAVALGLAIVVGVTYGTDPGAPFYPTRVSVEAMNLPGDLGARASAQITRLEARIREAKQSTTAGDGPAVRAALVAYVEILVATDAGAYGDPRATTVIIVNVTRYVTDLDEMAPRVPAVARSALTEAQTKSQSVVAALTKAK